MRIRLQPWQLAVLVVALSGAAIGLVRWRHNAISYDARRMLATLPSERATLVFADVAALRKSGILDLLAGSRAAEEADYRKFVDQTGFDYRTDLDAVAAAFVNGASYFTIRGRFQWRQLAAYAISQGGECHYTICSLPGSSLERNISFYPLRTDVLALAVASDTNGVNMISPNQTVKLSPIPPEPVWVSAPSSAFAKVASLPAGVQSLLGPVAGADKITLAVGPQGPRAQLRLSVLCRSPEDAQAVLGELSAATEALRNAAPEAPRAGGQADWAGLLRAGAFSRSGLEVTGAWPLERGFLEALASGAP
ncbi:MAG TPA: hypothetical protein VGR73_12800 [Bryobacteraceae bacterium]|nr:hypothetical protein [Bryobacteraceae bacterium]